MPIGKNLLINTANVSATNENPILLENNISIDTVYNLVRFADDWSPLIHAIPPVVDIGDSVSVSAQVLAPIEKWDIWVYLANGEIDSNYADDYISTHLLIPNKRSEIKPKFSDTRLFTQVESEQIVFELRVIDVFGEFRTGQAIVTVQSTNDLLLDRNLFQPGTGDPLGIKFKLSSNRVARIDVADITGAHVTKLTETQYSAGWNTFRWNGITTQGDKIGSGLYLITLSSGGYHAMKKVMIVR